MESVVDRLFSEHNKVVGLLDEHSELSLRIATEATLRKVLVLSAASYFERYITDAVLRFVGDVSGESACVSALVANKAVRRQYHTYFQWDGNSANSFFALFGTEFKARMKGIVRGDDDLAKGIQAFLTIGLERNKMVHGDFGSYQIEKTTDEVMELYRRATVFVERIPDYLDDCGVVDEEG
ncbi:MAG: HEPN domain-containing protein [Chloroflexota bacterium]|nr:HEPN domain-containing protein [Chloroflexota bacterium]